MCCTIVINKGEKTIETPGEFVAHFGFEAPIEWCYRNVDMDSCLCQVDVKKALTEHDIQFREDCMNFYVTEPPAQNNQ